MIIRRFVTSLRQENWTTVTVEFLIVVAGIFVGLQVDDWNQSREARAEEAQYLERLSAEISEILAYAKADYERSTERLALLDAAVDAFSQPDGLPALNVTHCEAIGRSHIFADTVFYPPTVQELVATGQLAVIRDVNVRKALIGFGNAVDSARQMRDDVQIDRLTLARKYPELIDNGLSSWEQSACRFDLMQSSQAFLNDFVDNRRRYAGYVRNVLGNQVDALERLLTTITASSP